jgi:hypothetical protein
MAVKKSILFLAVMPCGLAGRYQNNNIDKMSILLRVEQCSSIFFHPRHILIVKRHMAAHHKMSPHLKGVQNYTWP